MQTTYAFVKTTYFKSEPRSPLNARMNRRYMRRQSKVNSNLISNGDRQDVSATVMPPINSKSDVRRPILDIRQHDRRKIQKKLKSL